MYRLGEDHIVRLPIRPACEVYVANELDWLGLIPQLRIPISRPVRAGMPTRYFPCRWAIVPWFEGKTASETPPDDAEARRLAECFLELHQITDEAPRNSSRGVPLSERTDVPERLERLRSETGFVDRRIWHAWDDALQARPSSEARWIHSDLHPDNVIVSAGSIAALIDWGGVTSGDVATDLASLWMLFDEADVRNEALATYGADASTVARSRGWAVLFGSVFSGSTKASMRQAGHEILKRVREESPGNREHGSLTLPGACRCNDRNWPNPPVAGPNGSRQRGSGDRTYMGPVRSWRSRPTSDIDDTFG